MLSPQELQTFKASVASSPTPTGSTTPAIDTKGMSMTGDQWASWAKNNASTPSTDTTPPRDYFTENVSQLPADLEKRGTDFFKEQTDASNDIAAGGALRANNSVFSGDYWKGVGTSLKGGAEGAMSTVHLAAGSTGDIINRVIVSPVVQSSPGLQKMIQNGGESFLNATNALGEKNSDTLAKLDQYGKDNPFIAKLARTLGDAVSFWVPEGASAIAPAIKKTGQEALAGFASGVEGVASKAAPVVEGVQNKVNDVKNLIGTTIKGRPLEEILATPEKDVYKLNATERKTYFDNAQNAVKEKANLAEQAVEKEHQVKMSSIQSEAETLNRQLAVASRDETLKLRPKITQALGKQSQEYRRLVDEEIATKGDVPVKADEVRQYVENRFSDNPDQAKAITNRLGIGAETSTVPVKPGELPTIQMGGAKEAADTTIGGIYKKTLSLGQDISTTAKKGARVFTPDEKLTDDAISTLVDFMSEKGVDLKNARQFWAKYAPIRNQLVSEAKPFVQSGTQTKMFANTLTRVARGVDVNNENFIKATEDLLGQKIGGKTRDAVAKLSANEKAEVAQNIDTQVKKDAIKLQAEKESKNLSDKEFETARQNRTRTIIKRVIYGSVGLGVDKYIKSKTGIGI